MSYLIAAYAVTILALGVYALGLQRERNSLCNHRKSNSG
ncbi:MAG: CcmD family protein [bacterium]|nr:CcmD family protein [bacterium]MCP5039757.1 CcmD family protein [bacterium]